LIKVKAMTLLIKQFIQLHIASCLLDTNILSTLFSNTLKLQSGPKCSMSLTKTSQLILSREIIVYSENHVKHLSTPVVKMQSVLAVKQVARAKIAVF
jgi:hypothetical protein